MLVAECITASFREVFLMPLVHFNDYNFLDLLRNCYEFFRGTDWPEVSDDPEVRSSPEFRKSSNASRSERLVTAIWSRTTASASVGSSVVHKHTCGQFLRRWIWSNAGDPFGHVKHVTQECSARECSPLGSRYPVERYFSKSWLKASS